MARAIADGMNVNIRGRNTPETAPDVCLVTYTVVDGASVESPSPRYSEAASPDYNQSVTALCADALADVKTAEGI